jgi:hypothetical protein
MTRKWLYLVANSIMHGMTELQEIEIESEGRKGSRVF